MQISINLKPDLVQRIDEAKGSKSRSMFIVGCILEHFTPLNADWEADKKDLMTQLETHKSTQLRLENEVEFLRQEYSKINDALAQRLLTETSPKKSWWDRIRGR